MSDKTGIHTNMKNKSICKETDVEKQFHFEVWGIFEEDIERELDPVMYECLENGTMEALDENEVKLALILKYPAEVRFKRNITIDIFEM